MTISDRVLGVYLNGSLPVPDAKTAFLTQARTLGDRQESMTDGEFDWRDQWIVRLVPKLLAVPGITLMGQANPPNADPAYDGFPVLGIDSSVDYVPPFGYAKAATASYEVFATLRDQGIIPPGVKFRVCLPTPYAIDVTFVNRDDQARFLPILEATMADEIDDITIIPPQDLIIQLDAAIEVAVIEGAFAATESLADELGIADSLRNAMSLIPAGIPRHLHTCYGDYHHTHFTRPRDLNTCMTLANAAAPDFVSMPADAVSGVDPEYYRPLHGLGDYGLALGVIPYTGDAACAQRLIEAALLGSGRSFAVAAECGLSRITETPGGPSLDDLLKLHAQFSAPVR
jgi:hypothetical protein